MNIAIGSDHAGYEMKKTVKSWLEEHGHAVNDMGPYSDESVDYPDYARKVAEAVARGEYEQGILLCGSGVGVSISANKIRGIRAALAFNPEIAALARQHNNANVLCFPARFTDVETVRASLDNWFAASFEGGRHARRVEKIEP
ncbi:MULTISPECIES: ribose 5-phosphate isomerase B [Prosthecochloris]|uniref:Ribose 5-phosphate isomerase B n=1 Tax=Prosthecochloris vibrioformis TaxID=1098 RepID=A0A5C4S1A0_PROVB|nr:MULTISPECIES: ribose 5-phosphate isomerase B [Prosthecochloris]ANT64869.1 Ribose-5-phosphate isomerase B [Prosthecochloris sp. CIB 2401]TNJ37045.1 ribose 5-phosphate isomerase B [Prosthecochloris vibrioformis]